MRRSLMWCGAILLVAGSACRSAEPSKEVGDEDEVDDATSIGDSDADDDTDDEQNDEDGDEGSEEGSPALDASTRTRDAGADARADAMVTRDTGTRFPAQSDARINPPTGNPPSGGAGPVPATGQTCLQGSGDFTNNGPYRVQREDVTIESQGAYTIFYPNPLESDCKHPIVAWGNGTAVTGADIYGFYQEHAASWGIVVIASHDDSVGSGEFHTAGLDYLLAQNEEPGSTFYGKLSSKAGTSGHSQGGAGANAAARHPNVIAIGNVQGAFGTAPADKAFLCLTGTEDIATEGCKTAVSRTSSPALYANWQGGDHIVTSTLAGFIIGDRGTTQYVRLYTAWFRCFLGDDGDACTMFAGGESCPVCQDSGWAEIFANNL